MKVSEGYEGEGLPFFRCMLCGDVLSVWDLDKHHGCPKCGSKKIKNTGLGFWEKCWQVIKHPLVWKWKQRPEWAE